MSSSLLFTRGCWNGISFTTAAPEFRELFRAKKRIAGGAQGTCFAAVADGATADCCLKVLRANKLRSLSRRALRRGEEVGHVEVEKFSRGKGDGSGVVWVRSEDGTLSVCRRLVGDREEEFEELSLREQVDLFGLEDGSDEAGLSNEDRRLPTNFLTFLRTREENLLEARLANEVSDACNYESVLRVGSVLEDFGSSEYPFKHTMIFVTQLHKCDLFDYISNPKNNLLERGFPEEIALSIFGQITTAVAAAHSAGIVHQDLKLENILVQRHTERWNRIKIVLCDFGLAMRVPKDGKSEVRCGTASYWPPEVCDKQVSPFDLLRAEAWSLGVILYTLLQGYPPFAVQPWCCMRFEKLRQDRKLACDSSDLDWFYTSNFSKKTRTMVSSLLAWSPEDRLRVADIKQEFPCLFDVKIKEETLNVADKENVRNRVSPAGNLSRFLRLIDLKK